MDYLQCAVKKDIAKLQAVVVTLPSHGFVWCFYDANIPANPPHMP